MSHLLDQLELEVLVADPAEARQLQERLSRLHHQALAEVLARVLDQLSPPGTLHRLETLTLELGAIPADHLERQFPERLERALRQTLPSRLLTAQRRPQPAVDPLATPGPDRDQDQGARGPSPLPAASPGPEAVSPRSGEPASPLPRSAQEATAPPPAAPLATPGPDRDQDQGARGPGPLPADSSGPEAVSPGAGESARSAAQPGQGAPEASPLELLAWFAATGTLPWWAPRHDTRLIPSTVADALRLRPEVLNPFLHQLASASTAQQRLLAALDPSQQLALRQAWRLDTREDAANQPPPESSERRPPSSDNDAEPKALSPSTEAPNMPLEAPAPPLLSRQPALDTITVDGAGLTLLGPFLERLFERLSWLTPERRFRDAATQQRAMALLGYLVDGEPEPPEWRLTLAKLLCGAPLDVVCTLEEALRAEELAEAEKLLRAVLAHGEGLLGDEVDTLRATWLQRPGRLSWRPQAWLLAVERRDDGDEALKQLPWNVTWIRLPWMAELVQVAW
jgi:hypothetical protein